MKFAHYNQTTKEIIGFYTPEIHGENIPTPNIEIPDNIWMAHLEGQKKLINQTEDGFVDFVPDPEEVKETLRKTKIDRAKSILAQRITAGFNFDAVGTLYHYPSKIEDQIHLESVYRMGVDYELEVRTTDAKHKRIAPKGRVLHTAAQIATVFGTAALKAKELKDFAGALICSIENATTISELNAINETVGWP